MRFYALEEWLGDQLDKVPWRWIFGPLALALAVVVVVNWLVWHGY